MSGRLALRIRVTIAFALTATVALVALGVFFYFRVESTLVAQQRSSLQGQLDALARLPSDSRGRAIVAMDDATYAQVLSRDGTVVHTSAQVTEAMLPVALLDGSGDTLSTLDVALADEREPETALILASRQGDEVLVVGTSREDISDALQGVLTQLLIGGPMLLVLASGAGYLVAGAALRPVGRMERQAAQISAQRSSERLPLPAADDELRSLGVTLNAMLDRLDAALQTERRFVAEASHELRTPLALLRTELDLALSRTRSTDELLDALRSASEEVDRLTRLSEQLLPLGSTPQSGVAQQVDLRVVADTVARRFATAADSRERAVRVDGASSLCVTGDPDALDRALSNLVDNALRHGSGDVTVVAGAEDGQAVVTVADAGGGSDDPTPNGSGLGLAIVRAIVEAHDGTLALDGDQQGTVVTVRLPC